MKPAIDIPIPWQKLELTGTNGILLIVGAPDSGKTIFARYLFQRLAADGRRVALLDGDPGQSSLGPPTTMTVLFPVTGQTAFPPHGKTWRWCVGSTTPSGHMLRVIVGAKRLAEAAYSAGAQTVVYDTSGLVDPSGGGAALKFAKFNLLQPTVVYAIQKEQELEPILQPLRRIRRTRVVVLDPSLAVHRRDAADRQANRANQFARYFQGALPRWVDWSHLAVFPYPQFALNRLLALEDEAGFTLGLGIIQSIDRPGRRVEILPPLASLDRVAALQMVDVFLDPGTFRDRRI